MCQHGRRHRQFLCSLRPALHGFSAQFSTPMHYHQRHRQDTCLPGLIGPLEGVPVGDALVSSSCQAAVMRANGGLRGHGELHDAFLCSFRLASQLLSLSARLLCKHADSNIFLHSPCHWKKVLSLVLLPLYCKSFHSSSSSIFLFIEAFHHGRHYIHRL